MRQKRKKISNKPTVSVVIPTYNRAKYVTETIDSVLSQSYTDYEIIVVDDGSTDNTREALAPYMDRIRYIHQQNSGVSAARNRGIKAARGKWIAFLDSDDIWLPEKLAVQIKDISKYPGVCLHTTNAGLYRERIGREVNLFDFTGFSKELSEMPAIIERALNIPTQVRSCAISVCVDPTENAF